MIQDPELLKRLNATVDLAIGAGLMTEVLVTALEQALKHGYDSSKVSMDQHIVDLIETSAFFEWGL